MDLNKVAILRRLDNIIRLYGEAKEDNENEFVYSVPSEPLARSN